MKDYSIDDFSLPCQCGGTVHFKVIIGTDQEEKLTSLGFLAGCDTCQRSSAMAEDIHEAYSHSQSFRAYSGVSLAEYSEFCQREMKKSY
ncbi:hypothetical protein V9O75_002824 [Shigella sonnei]